MVSVPACVNFPLYHKVQEFSFGTGSPGWSRKKGRKTVVVWWWFQVGDNPKSTIGSTHLPKNNQTDRYSFNGFFSRTTRVSQQQKVQTNLDFNEAREDVLAVALAGPHANHLHLAPDR